LWDSIWYENGMTERKNTQLPSDSEAALDRTRATDEERLKLRYAFVVTIVALSTLIAILLIGARKWSNAKDAAAVISPIAGVVGTIVGAYLGHQAGSAGRERAAAEHREQTRIAQQLAAVADPAPAARILGIDLDAESRGGSDAQSERQ
jgi:hypothetical protein